MRPILLILAFSFMLCFSFSATAANRFWVASTTSNWNNAANWSTMSGGAGGAGVPATTDAVTFDGNGLGNCTINLTIKITSINVTAAYTGTISQGTFAITTSAAGTFAGGTFNGGSGNINVQGIFTLSGTAFTSTSGILEFNNTVNFTSATFTHNNGTVRFNTTGPATQNITGTSPTLYIAEFVGLSRVYKIASTGSLTVTHSLNITGTGYTTINTGTIDVLGDINITNTAVGGGGNATINIDGTGTQNINGSTASAYGALPKVVINKASGALNLFSFISFANSLTYTAGTMNPGTSTACAVASLTISGSPTFYNFTIDGIGATTLTIPAGSTVTATNNLDFENSTNNIIVNTGTIAVQGNIIDNNSGLSGGGTGLILINGSSSQTITSTGVIDQGKFPDVKISNTGGTVTFPSLITVVGDWTYTSGTLDVNTNNSTVVFENTMTITGTHTLNNVTFNGNAAYTITTATGTLLTVTGTLTTMGSANLTFTTPTAAANAIEAQGDIVINNTGTTGGGKAGFLIDGAANQNFTSTAASGQGWLPYVTIQKTAGTLTMGGTTSFSRNFTYTSGTVDATTNGSTAVFGSNNINVKSNGMSFDNVSIVSNTVTLGNNMTAAGNINITGTATLTPNNRSIFVGGNWSDYSTAGFDEGSGTGTVNFNGSSLQAITVTGGEDFYNLTSSNTGAGIFLNNDVNISNKLTMTSGDINLNSNTVTLGTSTANTGTLTYTSGSMTNSGFFTRWYDNSTFANGNVAGLFPMGAVSGDVRPFHIAPTTGPTTGGTISVSHTYINDWRYIFVTDVDAKILLTENDSYWTVVTGNGLAGGTYNLRGEGTGFGIINNVNDLRLILQSSVVAIPATNGGTVTDPQVNRKTVSLTDLNNSFFIATSDASDILPLTLISFNARADNNKVNIDWATANEVNTDYFLVQRSKDGTTWETIQKVNAVGANTSSNTNYTAEDQNPYNGISFYRLIEIDRDGKQTNSDVRKVSIGNTSANVVVYPNPATDKISISFPTADRYQISLINAIGQIINRTSVNDSHIDMNVSSLSAGVYFINISHGSTTETKKIIVKR